MMYRSIGATGPVRACLLIALLFSWGCGDSSDPTSLDSAQGTLDVDPANADSPNSTQGKGNKPDTPPPGKMIIVLQDAGDPSAVAREHGVQAEFVYTTVVRGFSGSISEAARAGLMKDGRVRKLVRDQEFSVDDGPFATQSWGLDRIDQRTPTLDQSYNFSSTGAGVTAYVMDTGIRFSHSDFGGRASPGFDAFGGDGSDCAGHGTHVAGTVGGTLYGVAKAVSLVSVRVMNCSGYGSTSTVLAGLDWIAANASRPAVVNMSLGGAGDEVIDGAVLSVIEAGIPVVVAAGNSTEDACDFSPARVAEAMTIGASSETDARASWSNWGMCVDWFAPGVSIPSDGFSDDDAVSVKSGTSMASPHTAGAVALYLEAHPTAEPAEVANALAEMTTKGVVGGSFSPASDLLYTLEDGSDGTLGNASPVAGFSSECADLVCQFSDESWDPDGTIVGWQWGFGDQRGSLDRNPSHTFPAPGTYAVTLIARDDGGITSAAARQVVVDVGDSGPTLPENTPPVADFTSECVELGCEFLDQSSDSDGQISEWRWDFGDGTSEVTQVAEAGLQHEFSASGTYRVTLQVTDDAGATASTSKDLEVVAPVNDGLTLQAVGTKEKGLHLLDLTWQGATSAQVAVHVTGFSVVTVDNTGSYRYETGNRGKGTYTVSVCDVGTGACSAEQTVEF